MSSPLPVREQRSLVAIATTGEEQRTTSWGPRRRDADRAKVEFGHEYSLLWWCVGFGRIADHHGTTGVRDSRSRPSGARAGGTRDSGRRKNDAASEVRRRTARDRNLGPHDEERRGRVGGRRAGGRGWPRRRSPGNAGPRRLAIVAQTRAVETGRDRRAGQVGRAHPHQPRGWRGRWPVQGIAPLPCRASACRL